MPHSTLASLVELTHQLRDAFVTELDRGNRTSVWRPHQATFASCTGTTNKGEFADAVAQAVACSCFAMESARKWLRETGAATWLSATSAPLLRDIFQLTLRDTKSIASTPVIAAVSRVRQFLTHDRVSAIGQMLPGTSADRLVYFYEAFLRVYDPSIRSGKGVFYTPHELVEFVVQSIDVALRDDFQLPDGIIDTSTWRDSDRTQENRALQGDGHDDQPFVRLLDPAMGTGAFLLAAAELMRRRFRARRPDDQRCPPLERSLWNDFVTSTLLPRLCGQELMLPALVLAHLSMAAWLAESGFEFNRPGTIEFRLANTMQQPQAGVTFSPGEPNLFTVILGNPPFSGISDNRQSWMRDLLRGRDPITGASVANYFRANGAALGERKHWLEDDYVKFMRFAHWQIEKAGCGIVALVTNHAYLDNVTFRGMREQLLSTFPRITVVDLHGNMRTGIRQHGGQADESVFDIGQGIAISVLRRPCRATTRSRDVSYTSLLGARQTKLATLARHDIGTIPHDKLDARPPYFFLVPKENQSHVEYESGWRICDAMPLNSTAVVTARDRFVVAFDRAELEQRLERFADPTISDDVIRQQYFGNTRSRKYPAGDTRGWQLSQARQWMYHNPQWRQYIRSCLYRPFDRRSVFWAPGMIDWPRKNVMEQLAQPGNVALITRRQIPAAQPCTYFWVTDTITIDGVIRSDNRGSESVFPLYVSAGNGEPESKQEQVAGTDARKSLDGRLANFSDAFVGESMKKLGLQWVANEPVSLSCREAAATTCTPRELFHYIYAIFHAPSYRQRFAEYLHTDFPRLPIPSEVPLFRDLARCGRQLIDLHLLCRDNATQAATRTRVPASSAGSPRLEAGFPKHTDGHVWLNDQSQITFVDADVWEFRVGTHQVCHKWLKDRKQRPLSRTDLDRFRQITEAIGQTIQIMAKIDRTIARHGGWKTAF